VHDAVLLAGLLRGLAAHLLEDSAAVPDVPDELLRTAVWQAARDGLGASLWHPLAGRMRPAAEVVAALEETAMPALDALGDAPLVQAARERRRVVGTGAARQRQRHAEAGLPGVLDLLTDEFLA
jgi:carboxylate-amine ligase